MIVGVPRETYPGERRVALVPVIIPQLAKAGMEVIVEAGAGVAAGFPDADYAAKGAKVIADRASVRASGCRYANAVLRLERSNGPCRFAALSLQSSPHRISASDGIAGNN